MKLNNEQKIVIEASKLSNNNNFHNLVEMLKNTLCWSKVFQYAAKNKVLFLLYHNIMKCGMNESIPFYYKQILDDALYCNNIRNQERLLELDKMRIQMKKHNIAFAPVKGGYLIDNVYKNRSIRTTNDIDALIKRKDISLIDEIMNENGYTIREYDNENGRVLIPDGKKKMLYKTSMYNLLPYMKISNVLPRTLVIFDLSFALDFSLNTTPVDEMLDATIQSDNDNNLMPEHFLVHMCCHHYREASNVAWMLTGKDLNIIKFCDVREFVLQKMDSNSIARSVEFAKKHGLEKALYFTIYFTKKIYNDGYESDILKSLCIKDEKFLYQFGEKDYDNLYTRKKDFWLSLFSDDSKDEVTEEPKYKYLL